MQTREGKSQGRDRGRMKMAALVGALSYHITCLVLWSAQVLGEAVEMGLVGLHWVGCSSLGGAVGGQGSHLA